MFGFKNWLSKRFANNTVAPLPTPETVPLINRTTDPTVYHKKTDNGNFLPPNPEKMVLHIPSSLNFEEEVLVMSLISCNGLIPVRGDGTARGEGTAYEYNAVAVDEVSLIMHTKRTLMPIDHLLDADYLPDILGYKMCLVMSEDGKKFSGIVAVVTIQLSGKKPIYKSHAKNGYHPTMGIEYVKELRNASKKVSSNIVNVEKEQPLTDWECGEKYAGTEGCVLSVAFMGDDSIVRKVGREYLKGMHKIVSDYEFSTGLCSTFYEVGKVISVPDAGTQGKGCCKGIHFFLSPEYAINYAWISMITVKKPIWTKKFYIPRADEDTLENLQPIITQQPAANSNSMIINNLRFRNRQSED